jgi:predicted enzyme related to lactoylglutathione lyase
VDIAVADPDAAKAFYAPIFDWSYVDTGPDFGNYQIAQVRGRSAAAIGPLQSEDQHSAWTVYLASDDVDATAKLVTESGGSIIAEPFDIPGSGRMCIAADPQGAVFGVWQANGMIGAEAYGEPGTLVWTDVRTSDPDAARRFYAAVFGYRYEPVEGAPPDYLIIRFDGARDGEAVGGVGGMMGAPEGTPPHWIATFTVSDADKAADTARQGGGRTLSEPMDTPYGRMALLADPVGAPFFVIGAVGS